MFGLTSSSLILDHLDIEFFGWGDEPVCMHRDEVAGCSQQAYDQLSLAEAQKMMFLPSSKQMEEYAMEVRTPPPPPPPRFSALPPPCERGTGIWSLGYFTCLAGIYAGRAGM